MQAAEAEVQETEEALEGEARPEAPSSAAVIDRLEATMLEMVDAGAAVPVEMPVNHLRTPGLYVRTISMPAGTVLTSKIHKTEHPYIVHAGVAEVFVEGVGPQLIQAPYMGVTKPGTRRVLRIVEDCVWSTFHPCGDDESLEDIEARIIEPRLLPGGVNAHNEYMRQLTEQGLQALEEPKEEPWLG
ncbi:MAG: hypothetical protein ACRCVZ_13010 [Aestuariivirga sp.]